MTTPRPARYWVSLFVASSILLTACAGASGEAAAADSDRTETGDNTEGGSNANEPDTTVRGPLTTVSEAYDGIDYDAAPVASALRSDRNNDAFPPPLIDPGDIASGGVSPDGIPAIDNPQFMPIDEVDFIQPDEGVIVVEVDGEAKAYPIQILIWHEIVNDQIGGVPVSVTYCPLCNSALAFERVVGGRLLDFGTSGELFQSALVMYDRQTESLWTHFNGEGVVGHYAGVRLPVVPARTLSFEQVTTDFPDAVVLTRDTGASRPYGTNPYIGYDEESSDPIGPFFNGEVDPRLPPKTRVVGLFVDQEALAVAIGAPEETSVVAVTVGGRELVVFQQPGLASALDRASVATGRDVGQTAAFLARTDDGQDLTFAVAGDRIVDNETGSEWNMAGTAVAGELEGAVLEAVPQLNTFWFAWATYHPDTAIIEQ
jgi:hypothetical protein